MPAFGANNIIAQYLFADYLTQPHVLRALSDGTLAPIAAEQDASAPARHFYDLCLTGKPIPAGPSMNQVWRELERAELQVVCGVESVGAIARATAGRIRQSQEPR